MDADHDQLVLYTLAQNYYYNKWIQAVTNNAPTSFTFSTNATPSANVFIAQNITVASGVTVTCGTQTCFFVAQSFNNYGTIVSPNGATGAPSPGADIGNGGSAGHPERGWLAWRGRQHWGNHKRWRGRRGRWRVLRSE
jgi:hypothetical protein